jgi:SHS2 domain-containing protein
MNLPYEYCDEIAMADIAFKACGRTLEDVFRAAADATINVMVEDPESIRPEVERKIEVESDSLEMLLFNFLNEIIYYKDAECLLLRVRSVRIQQNGDRSVLRAESFGEKIEPERHQMRVDVKAVTLHRFSLKRADDGWEAFAILDI